MKSILPGKKTYIAAALLVVYAILSVYLGKMTVAQAIPWVLNGLGFAGLRAAIA